nr:MAG TPA: hypothetical protein [Caudoviricetes sp.]
MQHGLFTISFIILSHNAKFVKQKERSYDRSFITL